MNAVKWTKRLKYLNFLFTTFQMNKRMITYTTPKERIYKDGINLCRILSENIMGSTKNVIMLAKIENTDKNSPKENICLGFFAHSIKVDVPTAELKITFSRVIEANAAIKISRKTVTVHSPF